jgi:exodeoxyribonuclease VII large subunit
MEDLWAFNEEVVARAIYDSRIPVISAVGHEPDVTIADFVADLRAATPSNAAELAVPDQNDLYARLEQLDIRMRQAVERGLSERRSRLTKLAASRALSSPENYLQDRRMLLDYQQRRLIAGLNVSVGQQQRRLAALAAALDALSPLKVLGRGYSIARLEDGAVLTSADQAPPDTPFRLRLADGELACRVERKED